MRFGLMEGWYCQFLEDDMKTPLEVFATARKLATLIYRLLRWGQPYVNEGASDHLQRRASRWEDLDYSEHQQRTFFCNQ